MTGRKRWQHAALSASLAISVLALAGGTATAQRSGLCAVLATDELAAAIPGSFDQPTGGAVDFCQWHGTTTSGSGVDVLAYTLPGSATDMPGAETLDIGGRPAFSMTDPAMTTPTHAVGIEAANGGLLVLTVGTDDAAIDLPAVTTALAAKAVERLESGAVAPASTAAPGASAVAMGDGICARATPEEIAAAAGLDVELTMQDLEIACSWESVGGEGFTLIYAAQQDPGVFEAMLGSLDAEEVDGPGEQDWWAGALSSLFSRQGDLVLQVSYTSSDSPTEEDLKQKALAVMTVLLEP